MTDLATGLYAHGAIMAALIQRIQTGKGQKISCDLLSTQVRIWLELGDVHKLCWQVPPTLLRRHFMPYKHWQNSKFLDYLPPSLFLSS